jgi:hypothetical protein
MTVRDWLARQDAAQDSYTRLRYNARLRILGERAADETRGDEQRRADAAEAVALAAKISARPI